MSMSLRKRMILLALLPVTLVASLLTAVFLWHYLWTRRKNGRIN